MKITKVQQEIIEFLLKQDKALSLYDVAKQTARSYYSVYSTYQLLEKNDVLDVERKIINNKERVLIKIRNNNLILELAIETRGNPKLKVENV